MFLTNQYQFLKKLCCRAIQIFIAVGLASGGLSIAAEVNAENKNEDFTDDKVLVITANRIATELASLPNNSGVLTQDELDFIAHTHINEALARIPGTWISRGNGQEHLTAIRSPVFTGPGSCGEFLMMEDNVPLRATGFCNVNQLFDANTEQAARIEVVRGANSAFYGSNAIHGIVNVISPQPQENYFGGSLEAGPHDYFRLKRSYQNVSDKRSYLINLNASHDGGYKESSGFDQQKLTLRHFTELSELSVNTLISASHLDQETAGFLQQGPDAYKEERFQKINEFPEAYRDAQSIRVQTRIESNQSSDFSWHITPYLRSNEMAFLMHFLPGQPVEKNGHDSVGIQWQSRIQFAQSELVWGLDSEFTEASLSQFQNDTTATGSAFLNAVLPQGQHYDYRVQAKAAAIYSNWRRWISSNTSITLAGRLDYLRYRYDNRMLDGNSRDDGTSCGFGGCRYTRPSDRNDIFQDFSYAVAFDQRIKSNLYSYLKLDRAFRAPQATELYRLQSGQLESSVDSQKADSIELGIRASRVELSWEANLFQMDKTDVIFQNNDREIVSGGKTSHRGVELLVQQKINPEWNWQGNFTYAEHKYENNADLRGLNEVQIINNFIDTAPKTIGSLQLEWHPSSSITAELEWTHLGDYFTNPENTRDYQGHDLINFRLGYRWSESWSGAIRVINLSNEKYAERADFAFGNDRYFVGEPRSVYLTLIGTLN